MRRKHKCSAEPRAAGNTAPSQWTTVARLAGISFVIAGSGVVAVGLFINPMMTEFGWPNGLTSSIATAFSLAALVAATPVGIALDRFGARSVTTVGALAASSGFLWASRCHTLRGMLAAFALAGVGYCASFYVPSAVVVSNRMGSQKSLAMGIVLSAMSIGAALFSLLIARSIEAYGWRLTSVVLAGLAAATLPLTVWAGPTGPPNLRKKPDCASNNSTTRPHRLNLLFSPAFMIASVGGALFATGMGAIYYHVVSMLIKAGVSAYLAALLFGMTWLLSAIGSLVFGVLGDRVGAKPILSGSLCSCGFGLLFLLGAGKGRSGVECVVAFVVLWGTAANSVFQFIPVILAERFGSQNLGTLLGVQSAIMGIAGAVAPVATGLLYDKFSDYRLPIYLSASATFAAFALMLLIQVPKRVDSALPIRKGEPIV